MRSPRPVFHPGPLTAMTAVRLPRSRSTRDAARHMRRALELAERGRGHTAPNPIVGAVLVRNGRVVGEGWHRAIGRHHAEVEALTRAGRAARGATLYVTLEPCAHWGRTPPCADALLAAGIARCVVALRDPDPRVNGRGLRGLRAAGVEVELGLLAGEARAQLAGYLHSRVQGVPRITWKVAASLDGRVRPGPGIASLRIGPDRPPRVTDAIVTGMHEPGTSHHMLLEGFADRAVLLRAGSEAESKGYLAHEFGDACLVERWAPGP